MLSVALSRLDIERAIAPCPPLLGIEATFLDAVDLLAQSSLGCVLVVSGLPADTRPLGIITERDIVRGLAAWGRLDGSLADVMTQPVVTLSRSTITDGAMLWTTLQRLAVSHVPVIDAAGHTLGLLTPASVNQALALAVQSIQLGPQVELSDPPGMPAAEWSAAKASYLHEIATALHTSETTNRSILQAVPDLLLRVRQDGKYLEVLSRGNCPQFLESESLESDGTVTLDYPPLLPPEVIARKRHYIQRAVATGHLQVFEQQVEIAGVKYYEEVRVVPLQGDETLVMVRDITDRKVLELALQSSEAKSRAILATIPDLMFRVSTEGQYLEYVCNQRTGDIIPLTVDATGQYMADFVPEDMWRRQMHYLRLALATRELQVYEQQIQIGDRWKLEEVRVAPLDEQSGLFMIRDLTERHQAALDLQHRIDRERLIAQVTQNIRQSLDLDQILQTTVTRVRQFLAADRVLIYRFNAEWGGDMIVESVEPGWLSVVGASVHDPCFTGELVERYRQGQVCQIDDLQQFGLNSCHMALLSQFQVRANLAVPITCEGVLWGLLCVHQCAAPRQWQAEEVELLTQLTAQLAIALQQALLYQHLQAELRERQRAETILRSMVEGTAAVTGDDFFLALVRHIAADLEIDYVLVSELMDGNQVGCALSSSASERTIEPHLQTLAFWASDQSQDSLDHSFWRTPCQETLQQGFFYCPTGVQALFPEAVGLVDLRADSYLGVALQDSQGRAIGGLCVLDTQPLAEPDQAIALLRVFAARAGAELERQRATRALERLNDELETHVLQRTQAWQNSEARFRRLAGNLPGMVYRYITHPQGPASFTYVSPRSQELFELEPAAVLQTSTLLWEHIHPDDLERLQRAAIAAVRDGFVLWNVEHRIVTSSGCVKWVQSAAQPTSLTNGDILWEGFSLDISERKQLELSLQASEAKLHYILNSAIAAICNFRVYGDGTWECHYYSPGFESILGYTPDELMAHKLLWMSRVHPEDLTTIIYPLHERIVAGMGTTCYEYRVYRRDGCLRWIAATLTSQWDEAAGVWVVTTVDTDISDRKQAELALQNKTSELEALVNALPDIYFRLDEHSVICDYYCSNEALLYVPAAQFLGQPLDRVLPPDLAQQFTQAIAQAKQTQALVTLEYPLQVPSGLQYFEARLQPLGEHQVIAIVRDISDRKRLEVERQRAQQDLQIQKDFLQRVIDSIPSCILVKDKDLQIQVINHAMADLYGLTIAEARGRSMLDFSPRLPMAQRQQFLLEDQAVMRSGQTFVKQDRMVTLNQQVRWYQTTLKAFVNDQDEPVGLIVNSVDITERKQTEIALKNSEERLQLAVDGSGDGLWDWNILTGDLYLSPHWFRLLGYAVNELPSHISTWENRLHPEDKPLVKQALERHLRDASVPYRLEFRLLTKTGEWKWFLDYGKVVTRDSEGNPCRMMGTNRDISDRKAAEAALFNSEQKFRGLFEMTGDAVMLLTADGCFDCNPQTLKMFGCRSKQEFCSQPPSYFSPRYQPNGDLSAPLIRQHIQTAFRQGFCRFEWEHCQADGTEFPAEVLLCQMELQGQSILQAIVRDIRDRRQAEQALQARMAQEALLGEIILNIRQSLELDAILETTVTEVRRVFNADRALIFRLTAEGAGVVIQESVLPAYPTTVAMYFPNECFPDACYELYCAGQPRIVADVATDEWAACLQDFMREFGVQSKLIAPIVQQDAQGQPRVWGVLSVHACAEQRLWQPTEAEFLQQISNQVAIAIQQSELYQQLQDTNRHLARATRLKDEFLANMSHELRTPLNAILGLSEALRSPVFGTVNDKQKQFLSTIQASGNHLLALINDILDLAKMESGKLDLNLGPVPVQQLCQSSLLLVEQQALQKEVRLHLRLDLPLAVCILVDELRIRQVLVNLLNNAVKFTPAGGTVELVVSCEPPAGGDVEPDLETGVPVVEVPRSASYLYFSVVDTGIGIAAEDLGKLFQTFVQLDSGLARHYEGTGLGLVLVRRIAQLHGGKVSVQSTVGVGSRFTVALPREVTQVLAPQAAVVEAGEDLESLWINGDAIQDRMLAQPIILLAEDHPDNAEMVSSYLAAQGYHMIVANNGERAIALVQDCSPDLVLMDIQMPVMDGLEAIRHLRSVPYGATVPIIALTALAMERDRDYCLAAGATEYLSKPLNLSQLLQTIQRLLLSRSAA